MLSRPIRLLGPRNLSHLLTPLPQDISTRASLQYEIQQSHRLRIVTNLIHFQGRLICSWWRVALGTGNHFGDFFFFFNQFYILDNWLCLGIIVVPLAMKDETLSTFVPTDPIQRAKYRGA